MSEILTKETGINGDAVRPPNAVPMETPPPDLIPSDEADSDVGESSGVFNSLAEEADENRPPSEDLLREVERTDEQLKTTGAQKSNHVPMVNFWKPSELRSFDPPPNQNLVGDYHIQRGTISVIAGPPGCGKSRAALWLGILGARGHGEWLGFEVHCQFRTLILQNENGLLRLHRDFARMPVSDDLDEWLRVSEPPITGLRLDNPHFRSDLKRVMREFKPHLVVIDPWNALARDSFEKDYQLAFENLRECLRESPENPACLIVHHLRKPKAEDRQRGRALGNLLSGSYTILSVPRSVFIMQPASDDVEDDRVVITPAKNNDGELGSRSAWARSAGGFLPVKDFNFDDYDKGATKSKGPTVTMEHIRSVFDGGRAWHPKAEAIRRLMEAANVGRTTAYDALKLTDGRFSSALVCAEGSDNLGLRV